MLQRTRCIRTMIFKDGAFPRRSRDYCASIWLFGTGPEAAQLPSWAEMPIISMKSL